MKIENLNDLFIDQLRDMYYAENRLVKALAEMSARATDPELATLFTDHAAESQDQANKLEEIMLSLAIEVKGEKCEAIEGLLKEAEELMANVQGDDLMDSVLVLAAQKIEHYEIATYGCLCAFAKCLGFKDVPSVLYEILEQEKRMDKYLTALADVDPGLNKHAHAA